MDNNKKIVVRQAEPRDAAALREIYAQPKAFAGTLQLPCPTERLWETRLSGIPDNMYAFVAELDGKVVGNLGLEVYANPRRRHAGTFGMGVHDAYQGRGVGTALLETALDLADNWLNLLRIELTVYTDNAAALALYEKFGFRIEGTSPLYAWRNGHYVDAHHMARIRPA